MFDTWYEGFSLNSQILNNQFVQPFRTYHVEEQPWSRQHFWVPARPRGLKFQEFSEIQRRGKSRSPPSFDNASDSTPGYSDSGSDDGRDAHLEAQLIQCTKGSACFLKKYPCTFPSSIVDYFGDCKGSLPSERVQNVIKKDYAELPSPGIE